MSKLIELSDQKAASLSGDESSHDPHVAEAEASRYVASTLVGREFYRIWKRNDARYLDFPVMTALRLMSLTYISHGMFMALNNGAPLVSEKVKVWKSGPIFPDLFKAMQITKKLRVKKVKISEKERRNRSVTLYSNEREFIYDVYRSHKHINSPRLLAYTTEPGTPWNDAIGKQEYISNESIYQFYSNLEGDN